MPSGGVILVCAAAAALWYGAIGIEHGAKKVSHATVKATHKIECLAIHGHKGCSKK